MLIGSIRSGRIIGFDPYFLDIAPESKRTIYLGIRGTLSVLTIILPLIGGLFIELLGYTFTFSIVTIVMFISLFLLWGKSTEKSSTQEIKISRKTK